MAATIATLRADPDASVGQIAAAAGVGRVTLYSHFASRGELIETALADVLDRGNRKLAALDLTGNPRDAFARLVASSWVLQDQSRSLLSAAQSELPQGRIRELHDQIETRVRQLLERGQREGAFRDDQPVSWMLATMHALMRGAADEVAAGRLDSEAASALLQTTLTSAYVQSSRD